MVAHTPSVPAFEGKNSRVTQRDTVSKPNQIPETKGGVGGEGRRAVAGIQSST